MTKDNVIILPVTTRLNVPFERIAYNALENELPEGFIIGWDKEGKFYFESSIADGGDVLWLLELTKHKLMEL